MASREEGSSSEASYPTKFDVWSSAAPLALRTSMDRLSSLMTSWTPEQQSALLEFVTQGPSLPASSFELLATLLERLSSPSQPNPETGSSSHGSARTNPTLPQAQGSRDDDHKLWYHQMPPNIGMYWCMIGDYGHRKKYVLHNWTKGLPYSRIYNSMQRHLQDWMQGEDRDKESGLLHLGHAFWNLGVLLYFSLVGADHVLDDCRWIDGRPGGRLRRQSGLTSPMDPSNSGDLVR